MGGRQGPLEDVEVTPSFWRGRRVFLTGHTGFKGSWLALWLKQLGAEVTGYALPPATTPSLFTLARVEQDLRSITGDIRDAKALHAALAGARPEVVIHMAAQPLVRRSYADPVETWSTNVMGLVNLFEAIRATAGVRAVVNVTSDKCYRNREWVWGYREDEALGGHDPYSASKAAAEIVGESYRDSYFPPARHSQHGVAVASARAGNVIGGGDWAADRLVADIMRAIESGTPVRIRNPHAIRPWQHVLEPLSGYLLLAEKLATEGAAFAEAWNFGPEAGEERPVQGIVEELVRRWGAGAAWQRDPGDHPHEASFLKLDVSKARAKLGWRPRLTLSQALDLIVEWHRVHRDGGDARAVTLAQIAAYAGRPVAVARPENTPA